MIGWIRSGLRRLAREPGGAHSEPGRPNAATMVDAGPEASVELCERAAALARAGRTEEAIDAYTQAIDMRHDCVPAMLSLGDLYAACGREEDAADQFRLALAFDPASAHANLGLGRLLRSQGRNEEAVASFRAATAAPDAPAEAWFELGLTLDRPAYGDEAIAAYRRALELRPDYAEAAVNLGLILLMDRGDARAAEDLFRLAASIAPQLVSAHANLGLALQEQGRFDEALAIFERAIRENPGVPELVWHRAIARLLRGDYGDAWDDHEARRRIYRGRFERSFPYPEWRGESPAGRRFLVYAEQGIGDELMFGSCISDLVARGARCVIECDRRLAGLYALSFPGAAVEGRARDGDAAWLEKYDIELQAPVGSLPRYLRRRRSDFPAHAGYLVADPARIAAWRERLARLGSKRKVGISWSGGTAKTRQALRSIPPEALAPLLRIGNVEFVSLQYGSAAREGELAAHGMHCWPEAVSSLDETAALMCALDAVVSVGNTVAHLAGALGRPVHVLLSATPDWRWLWEGESVPWYPSARALRQTRTGDWTPVLQRLAGVLQAQ